MGLKPALEKLRRLVVLEGLPPESGQKRRYESARCSLRGRVWKVLLCVHRASANRYIQLIERGPSIMHGKIEKDINRTLKSNEEYHMRTEDGKLRRFLNAYAHAHSDRQARRHRAMGGDATLTPSGYVQGMNILAAPLLHSMPEFDAGFSSTTSFSQDIAQGMEPAISERKMVPLSEMFSP